jgi:uncharacterized glyoxalase superfamily protein PhnB
MTDIAHVTLEVTDQASAEAFYRTVFGPDLPVQVRGSDAPTTGFRGFTVGVDLRGPAAVDDVFARALAAGATAIKPPEAQRWGGYSGVLRAPDGSVWKLATSAAPGAGGADPTIERVVLLLGVADVAASTRAYVDRGFEVAKDYGQYVELEPGEGAVTLGLYERTGLAAEFGVDPEGSGAHGLAIGVVGGGFVDVDGFAWETAPALEA